MSDEHLFWQELHRSLSRTITAMRPHAPAEWREDAVQNTLVRIMGLLESEKKQRKDISRAYARRVAFCTMANMWNRRQEELLEPDAVEAVRSSERDPEEQAANLELGRLVEKCLGRLKPERRRAVQLCVILGHSVPETAAILGLTRKQTENLVNRGRRQLREWLAEELAGRQDEARCVDAANVLLGCG